MTPISPWLAVTALALLAATGCSSDDEPDSRLGKSRPVGASSSEASASSGTGRPATGTATEEETATPTEEETSGSWTGGSDRALTRYVAAAQSYIPDLTEMFDGAYSDINIEAEQPSTLRYEYVFSRRIDHDSASKEIARQGPTLQTNCETVIAPEMVKAGIDEPRVRWVYYDRDGTEVASYLCTPDD